LISVILSAQKLQILRFGRRSYFAALRFLEVLAAIDPSFEATPEDATFLM
jgi:hypothetical protein